MTQTKIKMTALEREAFVILCMSNLIQGKDSIGSVLVKLRAQMLDMTQAQFSKLVGVSVRTISNIENDTGEQTIPTINKVFMPFGLTIGLLPKRSEITREAVELMDKDL